MTSSQTVHVKQNIQKAQAATDAQLEFTFEQRAKEGSAAGRWDYHSSVVQQSRVYQNGPNKAPAPSSTSATQVDVPAYMTHVTSPGFIQTVGTLLLFDFASHKVLAVAENVWEFLDGDGSEPEAALGMALDSLFDEESASTLEGVFKFPDVSLANPVPVSTATSGRCMYAILHRVADGIMVDLEPQWDDEADEEASNKFVDKNEIAAASIEQLQECEDTDSLCSTLVQEIKSLTGYDRVMLYKFHEDMHGEVVAEAKEEFLYPLLGLHFPANDIPQANRQLFVTVRVRMIVDIDADNVPLLQTSSLSSPIPLSRSTLRGVAGCHKEYCRNMGSRATLVMAVVVTLDPNRPPHLWGLVCCHHSVGPRATSYSLREACDFVIQAFALQLGMESEAARNEKDKAMVRMQEVLCGMLMTDAPLGLVRQSPNMQDLVPADGAVLVHAGKAWTLGAAPSEEQVGGGGGAGGEAGRGGTLGRADLRGCVLGRVQIKDIARWVEEVNSDGVASGVYTTNSLEAAGYPGAAELAPGVCGLAAARLSERGDFLMWFRGGAAKTVKWAGHTDNHSMEEGVNMHPRVSFSAFLEVAKLQSQSWQDSEIDAMQGLKLIVQDTLPDQGPQELRIRMETQLNAERLRIQSEVMQLAKNLINEMEAARLPIIGLNGAGTVTEWNAKAEALTKWTKMDALGCNFAASILAATSQQTFAEAMSVVGDGEEVRSMDLCLQARSAVGGALDRQVHLLSSLIGQHDTHGNLIGMRMVGQDITPIKVLTGEYKVAPDEARETLDSSDMLVFAIDEGGRVSEWNLVMEKITGLARDQVVNKKLVGEVMSTNPQLFMTDKQVHLEQFESALSEALKGQDTRNHEFHFNTQDGKQMATLMHIISKKGAEGEGGSAMCFMQDMMERRAVENASAVRMVAEAALQAKTMQLACLCHEIRNPLNGILSSISFMQDTDMTAEQKDLVVTTASCSKYLRRVVDDVLDLSKIEEGKLEVDFVPFSLQRVMDKTVAQEAETAEFRGLQLYCTQDPGCSAAVVCGDRLRVQQIVANFARNAVEYTKSGWVELKMTQKKAEEEGKFRFVFTVSDSGKGMSGEERERVFAIPQQEEESAVLAGAGLGLVVSRKLACLMGGTVSCERGVGGGSSFALELELGEADQPVEKDDVLDAQVERKRGVIYCTVGEWSTPEEIAAAEHFSPTFTSREEEAVVHAQRGEGEGEGGKEMVGAPVSPPLQQEVAQVGVGRKVGDGIGGPETPSPTILPRVEESQQEAELRLCLVQMESLYGGVVEVNVLREVVDWQEVAVLVGVTICRRDDGTTLLQQQEWGSAARVGTLGESLRAATQNAVLPVLRAVAAAN